MTEARRPGRRWPRPSAGFAMALGAGALAGLGQAPWGLWWLSVPALALALALIARAPGPASAFWRGWAVGAGLFALSMNWIIEPFLIEPERHAWMAPFALALLPGGLALFWGGAGWLAARLARPGALRALALVVTLAGAEALRGWIFGGFPWAMPGHIWIDTPLAQLGALIGALGLTLLTLALAAGLAVWGLTRDRAGLGAALLGFSLAGGGWAWGVVQLALPMPADRELRLRLVQPNADQALKWQLEWAEYYFFRHLELTAAPAVDGRTPDLVLWAETAVPFYLESPGDGLTMTAQAAGGATVVMGIQRQVPQDDGSARYFNSLAALDDAGQPVAVYDKHHLVPFGEYVPLLGALADRPGLDWMTAFVGSALLGYTPGPGPEVLDLGPAGRVLPLICYEAVFPRHLRLQTRPDWILQLTNDAWFGLHSGPYQHLALARLRAIEQGLPLVRVANTGVSAVIDARGRVQDQMGLAVEGFLDADLPGALPATLYARTGDAPWHLALGLALAAMILAARRRRIDTPGTGP